MHYDRDIEVPYDASLTKVSPEHLYTNKILKVKSRTKHIINMVTFVKMNIEIDIAGLSFIQNAVCTPIVRLSRVEIQCNTRLLGLVYYSKKRKDR